MSQNHSLMQRPQLVPWALTPDTQCSRTHRSNASRVLQNDRFRQPEFFLRGFPFLRCKIHCSGSSTALQFVLSWARSRFEGCAGPSARSWRRTCICPSLDRSRTLFPGAAWHPSVYSALLSVVVSLVSIRSDIFQFPFRLNQGTKEEFVGMTLEVTNESWDS